MAIEDDIIREAARRVADRLVPEPALRAPTRAHRDRAGEYRPRTEGATQPRTGDTAPIMAGIPTETIAIAGTGTTPHPGINTQLDDAHRRSSIAHSMAEGATTAERDLVNTEGAAPAELRRVAIDSRTVVWQRTVFPPDVALATRDDSGHPIFPDFDASEGSELRGSLDDVKEPAQFEPREQERQRKALLDEANGHLFQKVVDGPSIEKTGYWTTAGPIKTFAQAVNLMRWVHHGDPTAMEFLKRTVTRLGTDPTLPRTIGEVTALQYQNQAIARYNATVNGDRAPSPKLTNAGRAPGAIRHNQHPFHFAAGPPLLIAQPAQDAPPDAMEQDDPMPVPGGAADAADNGDVVDDGPAVYLGAARRAAIDRTIVHLAENPASDAMGPRGTTASIQRAVRWYTNVPTSHWPLGLRISLGERPTTMTATPWALDVGAWFTLNALSPMRGTESSVHRAAFLKIAVRILSIPGLFAKYVEVGGYVFNDLPLEHFPFPGTNVSYAQIIAWFMQHGINVGSDALLALESFARSRRNQIAGNDNLEAAVFSDDWPYTVKDIENVVLRAEDIWTALRFGTVRADATSDFPSFPAGVNTAVMENGQPFPQLPPSPDDFEIPEPPAVPNAPTV
ncbi:hypothetical protein DFH06DRAFT_1351020 [Mycena polygramma]|nr:hypothetical protein DFH06DRAFT_1351020 [Mycena polygramma]